MDLSSLPRVTERSKIPDIAGVYLYFLGEELVYVGKAVDMLQRSRFHADKEADSYCWISEDDPLKRTLIERGLIFLASPPLNKDLVIRPEITCGNCPKNFRPHKAAQLYCSLTCKNRAAQTRVRERAKQCQ